ncbi:MAG: uncharacterized protein KVP18_001182 [Porospora cf. gigantea A]|uniref:uncharacterized protein n=1 Tax=Porospora cf. gigantea A TaxID=2853593 RepID=UPI00355AADE0|nr:MAG: hypothetical protein KVP18_001182 [Porospora cf. gigantea A]
MSGAMADLESTMEETLGDLYKEKLASQADAAAAAEKSKLTAAGSGAAGAFGAGGVGGGGAAGTGAIDMAHFYGKGRWLQRSLASRGARLCCNRQLIMSCVPLDELHSEVGGEASAHAATLESFGSSSQLLACLLEPTL